MTTVQTTHDVTLYLVQRDGRAVGWSVGCTCDMTDPKMIFRSMGDAFGYAATHRALRSDGMPDGWEVEPADPTTGVWTDFVYHADCTDEDSTVDDHVLSWFHKGQGAARERVSRVRLTCSAGHTAEAILVDWDPPESIYYDGE